MKNNLLFDFIVDKKTKKVFVNREFAANLSLVWDAFTKQEILDQWWAPKPWQSKTKSMNFKVGGRTRALVNSRIYFNKSKNQFQNVKCFCRQK
jgi:uncharacterized protein YndB with AHSA1/START domain